MRCMLCSDWSLSHICPQCQAEFLRPLLTKRKILGNIPVYSFYQYTQIASLLHTKHTDLGYYVFSILAEVTMKPFQQSFEYKGKVAAVGVDDHTKNGYSHTALLCKVLASETIKPRYGRVRATNGVRYSGETFQYRLMHPRRFRVAPFKEEEVILVDDIITSGLTLTQAAEALHASGKKVLFCLTLADADKSP